MRAFRRQILILGGTPRYLITAVRNVYLFWSLVLLQNSGDICQEKLQGTKVFDEGAVCSLTSLIYVYKRRGEKVENKIAYRIKIITDAILNTLLYADDQSLLDIHLQNKP